MKSQALQTSFEWLGTLDYPSAFALQLERSALVRAHKHIHVFGLEHPAVVTFGKRANSEADLPWGSDVLRHNGISLVEADRGGQATLHSPGQLVIYPIVPLTDAGYTVRAYVRFLEEVTQAAFARVGVPTELHEGDPGIYTSAGKIAFCGIRIDQGVARHGLSLNISNDLGLFQWIRPCGEMSRPLDVLQNYVSISCLDFFEIWQKCFSDLLKLRSRSALQDQGLRIDEVLNA